MPLAVCGDASRMHMRFVCRCAYAAIVLSGLPAAASGQQEQCLQLAQNGVQSGTWDAIKTYFRSLNLGDEAKKDRSCLLLLRARIIELESHKQRLIEIIDGHLNGSINGTVASNQLGLVDIPEILRQIETISQELAYVPRTGGLFAAEKAFKDLKINLDLKRASTLCMLAEQTASKNPDWSKMAKLNESLRSELKIISDAEEALADYIRKTRG